MIRVARMAHVRLKARLRNQRVLHMRAAVVGWNGVAGTGASSVPLDAAASWREIFESRVTAMSPESGCRVL